MKICHHIPTCHVLHRDNFALTHSDYCFLLCNAVVFSSQTTRRLMPSLVCSELINKRRKKMFGAIVSVYRCMLHARHCFDRLALTLPPRPASHSPDLHPLLQRAVSALPVEPPPQQNIAVISYLQIVAALIGAVLLGKRPLNKPLAGAEYRRFGRNSRQPSLGLQVCSIQTPK